MQHQSKHYKWIFCFIILLVALGIAAPVLADYLGPNRTVTTTVSVCKVVLKECQYVEAKGEYRYHQTDSWSCSSESKPWESYPSNSRPCNAGNKGYEYWDRDESTQQTTVTYDPATISGSVQNCTLQNGWCVTSPTLSLSANEPLAGYNITLIEGTLNEGLPNGTTFACPNEATSCTVPLNEGENTFNYWALSSWGDSSLMGTSAARVDTVAPSVGLDISGTSGTNGWYVSPLTITATGADAMPGSGVASRLLSIDGGATWQPSVTLNEGVYKVDVTVADNAGNVSTSSATLSVDTTTPTIEVAVSGTLGKNNYYTSVVLQVAGDPKDATSGVAAFEVAVDGAAYQAYTAPISFSDGQHTIQFKACDAAGNCTETPQQTFLVDTLPPLVNLPSSWKLGTNVPYDVIDEGSGLAALRIVIEDEDEKYAKVAWNQEVSGHTYSQDIDWNGEFKDKTVAPPGTYLVWIKASDVAGNERFQLGKVIVPETNLFLSLLPTEAPAVSALPPAPPAELSEPDEAASLTTPPTVDFGGGTTQPGEATTQSVLLATGTAGAAAATTSGVLWGAAAAAAISAATAYALDATRKRKQAEEEQAARVRAEIAHDKAERAEKQQKQQENWNKQHPPQQQDPPPIPTGISPEAQQAYMHGGASAQGWINAHVPQLQQAYVKQQKQQKEAALKWEEKKKAEEAAAKNAQMLASLPGYLNSEKQGDSVTTAKLGGPKVVAALALDGDPPEEPGPLEWFWNGVKAVWNGIFGTRQPAPPAPVQPDPALQTAVANAYPTVVAQTTQTAQAIPTFTPTATLPPTFTPTLTLPPTSTPLAFPAGYIIDNKVRFRSDASLKASFEELSCGTQVQISGDKKVADGKTWQQVIYNGVKGWIATEWLDEERPVCANFAGKYAKYPGAGEAIQLTRLPFDPKTPLSSWWGFGNTTFAQQHKNDYYACTTGYHPGIDFGLPYGTPLTWNGNIDGKVVRIDSSSDLIYMKSEPHIVIRSGGFDFIYGHTSDIAEGLKQNAIVHPGDLIGYSGQDKDGNVHLHFEIRPAPPDGKTKSFFVINPLIFFSPELQNQWAPIFNGDPNASDYLNGDDSLSLGYYRNTPLSSCETKK